MQLTLRRDSLDAKSTQGELFVDDVFCCYTLELPVIDGRPGSAIPPGTYPVIITPSPKFQREMPLLLGIPGRSAIRIHWGNDDTDTEGCILVGETRSTDFIGRSRMAFDVLWAKLEGPARAGDCSITVIGGIPVTRV